MSAIGTPIGRDRSVRVGGASLRTTPVRTDTPERGGAEWESRLRARGIFTTRLLTPEVCTTIRERMALGTVEAAELFEGDGYRLDGNARRAAYVDVDRETLHLVEDRLDGSMREVATFFGVELQEREGTGFVRYPPGGFYGPHRDVADSPAWPAVSHRRITAVVFLNSSSAVDAGATFSGGELCVLEASAVVTPRAGWLVAFPAAWRHAVTPVVGGTREVVVDWFY